MQSDVSNSEPLIVGLDEPVNIEWELLKLTGDHPAFQGIKERLTR